MRNSQNEELDDMIFELNYNLQRRYREVQGPIDNKTFLRNLAIGAGVLLAAPLAALAIVWLVGH